MKIGINATVLHKNPVGLARCTYELTRAILETDSEFSIKVYTSSTQLKRLFPEGVDLVNPITSPSYGFKGQLMRFIWLQTILPLRLKKDKISLLYSTVPEGSFISSVKQIITVHDILPVRYPAMYPKMKYYFYHILPRLLKKVDGIVCVSQHAKEEVMSYYGVKDKPIYVVYEGCDTNTFYPRPRGIVEKKYGFKNYLLYVGDMRPYKNLERALEAFASLNLKDYLFVIAGRKDERFYPKVKEKVKELSLGDRVVFLGYVPDEDLPSLYSEACAFVFPSLYEGFGLPPLEAMACGCPVIVSKAASLPEVCGDAAYYVDPYSVESIADGIYKVLTDESLRQQLIQRGLERVKLFNWKDAALKVLSIIRELI